MRTKYKRAYKYRFYPTDEQKRILARTFGCARFVYNYFLRLRKQTHFLEQQSLNYHETSALLTALKKQAEYAWLNEVSCVPPQQTLRHLDRAFKNFFAGRAQYPVFKSKRGEQSAEYTRSAFTWDGTHLTLAKMEGPLPARWSRPLPPCAKPTTVTVSRDTADRYFVSILVEEDITPFPVVKSAVGLDLGLASMVVLSTGESVGNPADEQKLAKAQRRLARKQRGSRNRSRARLKVARIHVRIADRRRDYQHKLSTRIIRENQVVCVESLAVKNLLKNHCLAKSISDVGWGEFVRQLEYKANWYGRTLVKIDRFSPSSKRCSHCGHVLETVAKTRYYPNITHIGACIF